MDKQETFEKVFKEHLKVETYSKSIDSLYSPRSLNKINYKPYYQRNYVWDKQKASYFIESILLGTEIPPLIFFTNNEAIEVIDGRQRFETIKRYMDNDFALTKKGLNALTQLKNTTWDLLAKREPSIVEDFSETKLRIIEFKLVNEPPLDKNLEDQVKKEIFSRYNSGITPLKKAEIENANYDNDDLTNSFKNHFERNQDFKRLVYQTFFKPAKKNLGNPPVENILPFVRRFLVLPSFPINYFSRGSGRTDTLERLYENFAQNAHDHNAIIKSFEEKATFLSYAAKYAQDNSYTVNRLALECFLWGLGVLDLEEVDYELSSELKVSITKFIHENIYEYSEEDFAFAKEVMRRYSTTSRFFEERFGIDLGVYINADSSAKERIEKVKRPDDAATKLSQLESLRLNKPEPAKNSVDDISRILNKRRFRIRPSYQRKEVINDKKASSIVESILLGITLPAIFVFKRENGIHEVIDGQQRLLTILGFIGYNYANEKGETTYSKNHKFKLKNLRILKELNGLKFDDLDEDQQNRVLDFQLYVVEIDGKQNIDFDPVDLFIRLNNKPYPIKENSFEMWNSWADIQVIQYLKLLNQRYSKWFFVKEFKRAVDRDRMENEELITTLAFLEHNKNNRNASKMLDVYQKTDRINARVNTKAKVSSLLQEVSEDQIEKENFLKSIKSVETFVKKLKTVLLDKDKGKSELEPYLKSELDKILKADRKSRFFKRTVQDFYFLWLFLSSINLEMIRYYRLTIKEEIESAFKYLKDIPLEEQQDNKGYRRFQEILDNFINRYTKDSRNINLKEDEKYSLIKSQENTSSITKAPIFLGDDTEVDHIDPLAKGGKDEYDNLGITHKDENRSKGSKK